jgi:NAD(P)-dependent dehydrogenase (short-subunit alcohol dehydrogenase family)
VGRATARLLAERGHSIAAVGRNRDALAAIESEARIRGAPGALALRADVARAEEVAAAARAAEEALGPIDVWINNAMTSVFGPFSRVDLDDFRRVTEVTYLGVVFGTKAALEAMAPRGEGVIVQVGSSLAYRGIPLQSAYCGAKHAIQGFTESLRAELLHEGSRIHVTMVHLPALNTPQFDTVKSLLASRARPVPPIYQPEIAAKAIAWAIEHRRRELWVGAPTVATLVADRLFPGLLDRYLARTGVDAQTTDEPEPPRRPHSLWGPLPGDRGARGRFDDSSHERSPQLWATTHRAALGAAAGAVTALGALARAGRRRSARR